MTVEVRFLGTGNAFADGGRSHACIHVSGPGVSLLLDCGGAALPALKRALDPATIDAVAVTHLHGDHFGGIPFLVMEQHFAGRTRPLAIGGPAALAERLRLIESGLYPDFFAQPVAFPVRTVTLGEAPVELGGALVSAHPVRHVAEADPHGLRVRIGDTVIAYSGDAAWSDALPALAKGADLFICEATHFSREDPAHLSYRTLRAHRDELDCGRIVLTHLGAEALAHLGEIEWEHAADGTALTV